MLSVYAVPHGFLRMYEVQPSYRWCITSRYKGERGCLCKGKSLGRPFTTQGALHHWPPRIPYLSPCDSFHKRACLRYGFIPLNPETDGLKGCITAPIEADTPDTLQSVSQKLKYRLHIYPNV